MNFRLTLICKIKCVVLNMSCEISIRKSEVISHKNIGYLRDL